MCFDGKKAQMILIDSLIIALIVWVWIMVIQNWRTVAEYRKKYEQEDDI